MISDLDLKAKPFYLNDEDIQWIYQTISEMTLEEKVGQLFTLVSMFGTKEELDESFGIMKPGGIMYRAISTEQAVNCTELVNRYSKIPMLIAANLEKGGNGVSTDGTLLGSPMEIAATDDEKNAEKLAAVCASEGAAVGVNWAFAPIIDIDFNYHNPITNTRTYGSDPQRVKRMGTAYVKKLQEMGLAASIKHFPGDGRDERDQHLTPTVNDLSCEEWDRTYGEVYRSCIEAGAKTVMVGHILQPAWSKKLCPEIQDKNILPASLSQELMQGLLRGHLGFNGLICTDATTMAGFTVPVPRKLAVPMAINAGADMFLFTKNMKEDYGYMLDAAKSGYLLPERLQDALVRILALKASLKLYHTRELPTLEKARKFVGCEQHHEWAKEIADQSVTLVKEEQNVLPLDPKKYPRLLFYPIEAQAGIEYSAKTGVCAHIKELFEKEGFTCTVFEPENQYEGQVSPTEEFLSKYDLIVYVANLVTKSNQTTVRIEWQMPMGANCPHYIQSIPTIFISVENPYHLLDVPRIRTFINTYSSQDEVLEALLDKLMGRSEFKGISPVDAFCGRWDTHL